MKIKKDELKNIIDGFAGSKSITFNQNTLFSYNDELLVIAGLKTGFDNVTIPYAELSGILKLSPKKLNINSENGLKITGKKFETWISAVETDEFNEFPDIPEDFIELKTAIKTAIKIVIPNDDGSDFSCIKFQDNTIMSSDNLLINRVTLNEKLPTGLIRARHLKLIDTFIFWSENDKFLFFKTDNNTVYGLKKIESHEHHNFNEFDEHFEFEGDWVEFPDLSDSIKTANIFIGDENEKKEDKKRLVYVQVKDGKVYVKGENEKGYSVCDKEIESNNNFSFATNPERLITALSFSNKMKLGKNDSGDYAKALLEYENVELLIGFLEKEENE